jgi:hypothetical protein
MTKEQIDAVLDNVRSWPKEDQEELAEIARTIEAQRTGLYVLSEEERGVIADAEREQIVPDDDVEKVWKRHGIS